MADGFKNDGQRRMCKDITWYCQEPGVSWKTDPSIGCELAYFGPATLPGPGWFLYGGDTEKGQHEAPGEYMADLFNDAMHNAAQFIREGRFRE